MAKTIPKEAVEQLVEKRVAREVPILLKQKVRERLEEQLTAKIDVLIQEVLAELDDRGVDTDRTNVDMVGIARESVVDAMFGSESSEQIVDIAVGGRTNQGVSTKMALPEYDMPTKTIEVPIEGGDVENPDTIEVEVPDPKPMDLDATEKVLDEVYRMNAEQDAEDDEEDDPDIVPCGGLPWYQ